MNSLFTLFKTMTYEEFKQYCSDRTCDGNWSIAMAIYCIGIIKKIDAIKVKKFGFTLKKETKQAREEAWQKKIKEEE